MSYLIELFLYNVYVSISLDLFIYGATITLSATDFSLLIDRMIISIVKVFLKQALYILDFRSWDVRIIKLHKASQHQIRQLIKRVDRQSCCPMANPPLFL